MTSYKYVVLLSAAIPRAVGDAGQIAYVVDDAHDGKVLVSPVPDLATAVWVDVQSVIEKYATVGDATAAQGVVEGANGVYQQREHSRLQDDLYWLETQMREREELAFKRHAMSPALTPAERAAKYEMMRDNPPSLTIHGLGTIE